MRIWIDLANSPQVLFFRPIIKELLRAGHEVEITTRPYAQTVQLADRYSLPHTPIGDHGGRRISSLICQNVLRALELARWAHGRRFDLALSHNAYSQVVAARLLGIPAVTLMDYEHQPLNHIGFRLAKRVIVPEVFPSEMIRRYGAGSKAVTYPGLKEQISLADFVPQSDYRAAQGLPQDEPLVVIRPPANWTAYHRFENDLFDRVLTQIAAQNHRHLLFLARLPHQAASVHALPEITVAHRVYDGPNLLYHADLVISGGGTMNREAAILGTPTCTVFQGKLGAVDRYLISQKRMIQLHNPADLVQLPAAGRTSRRPALLNPNLIRQVVERLFPPGLL